MDGQFGREREELEHTVRGQLREATAEIERLSESPTAAAPVHQQGSNLPEVRYQESWRRRESVVFSSEVR